jgi:hypothetical protein
MIVISSGIKFYEGACCEQPNASDSSPPPRCHRCLLPSRPALPCAGKEVSGKMPGMQQWTDMQREHCQKLLNTADLGTAGTCMPLGTST